MKKVMVVFGTRPEAIKMCPLVLELKSRPELEVILTVTGQHRQMLDQVLEAFKITPDYDLSIMKEKQSLFDVTINILNGMTDDPEAECAAYEEKIASYGGIDLFMGGIGVDGHLAFNEPYTSLSSRTGVRDLTTETRLVNSRFFGNDPEKVPAKALSVGIGTVTDAREVLVLISGHNKARALAATVEGGVSQKWTCSALQLHNGAIIACDESACGELTVDTYKYFLDIEKNERL